MRQWKVIGCIAFSTVWFVMSLFVLFTGFTHSGVPAVGAGALLLLLSVTSFSHGARGRVARGALGLVGFLYFTLAAAHAVSMSLFLASIPLNAWGLYSALLGGKRFWQ